jgi:ABC-type nitrate/sulfonate/bicarbonate transport system permease component
MSIRLPARLTSPGAVRPMPVGVAPRRGIRLTRPVRQVIGILAGAVIWEILGRAEISLLVPPVTSIASAWWEVVADGTLAAAAGVSLQAFVIGIALAMALGLPLGFAIGRYRIPRIALSPFVNALMATPHIAVVPLILLWVGTGLEGRILAVFLFTFIPLLVNVEAGVLTVDRDLMEMARMFGAGERQLFRKVILPDSMPLVLAGIRLSIGRAVKGMVTGEIILASAGLGKLLLLYGQSLSAPRIYAVVITIVGFAMALTEAFRLIERRVLAWKEV